jgi:2-methylcitrate dehydratase PrpD
MESATTAVPIAASCGAITWACVTKPNSTKANSPPWARATATVAAPRAPRRKTTPTPHMARNFSPISATASDRISTGLAAISPKFRPRRR